MGGREGRGGRGGRRRRGKGGGLGRAKGQEVEGGRRAIGWKGRVRDEGAEKKGYLGMVDGMKKIGNR